MIKRTAILSLLAVLTASAQAYANGNEVDIISDGLSVVCEPSAMIYNQRTMIPVRAVSESIGCMVDWDEATNTATVTDTKNNTVLTVTVNESTMKKTVGEEVSEIEIDTPAMISDNRIFIPVRAVSEALGVTVEWDGVTRTVFMYTDEENFNAYNKNEFNVNGDQIGATCEGMGMTFEEFKSIYKLPEDMPEDTYTHIAERYIKVETLLESSI